MVRLRWGEREMLQKMTAPAQPPGAASPPAVPSGNPPPAHSSGFVTGRVAPAPLAPTLAAVSHAVAPGPLAAPTEAPPEVRGVCPGCGLNVWSDDEGRKRDGDDYFHGACVKGTCGGCGKVVHVDQDRKKVGGEYWHEDCAPGPSSRGRQRYY